MKQLRLCLVTDIKDKPMDEYLRFIEQAIRGGVTMVQLREKSISYDKIKTRALVLKNFLSPLNIPLIINDFVEIAIEIDADGVHVGNEDMDAVLLREKLGPNKIIGVSVETLKDIDNANNLPINYVAASAIFPSVTKLNCKTFWGIDGLKMVVEKSTHPVIAIGGINSHHVQDIFNTGAQGIAVISAIHDTHNPYEATERLLI
jgi:thiamine-phosphate pyrophosphorylase